MENWRYAVYGNILAQKVLCVDFEMFMFGAEQWSGWLGAKVRKKGMMRKFFILKEQKKTILEP